MNSFDKIKSILDERNNMPQGHKHIPDPIEGDTYKNQGRKLKQMGNRVPMEIIAKILAKGGE